MDIFKEYTFNNGVTLKNRIVMAPMTLYSGNEDLTLSKAEELFYLERSFGVGMVITAAVSVGTNAQAFKGQISAKSDYYLDSLSKMATAIKKNGSKAILQIHHGGRMNLPNLFLGQRIVAPSSIKALRDNLVIPETLTNEEVLDIIEDFKDATLRAIKSGFDGVEIHGANTYLVQQFFSPHSNRRIDVWGDRFLFPLLLTNEIIETVNNNTEKPFIIGYRFSPEELENPGITLTDTLLLIEKLKNTKIDYLHISLNKYNQSSIRDINDNNIIASMILKAIDNKMPLIGVGGIDSIDNLFNAFEVGYDLCAVGLSLIADPNFVQNLELGLEPSKIIDFSKLPIGLKTRLLRVENQILERGFVFLNK